MNYFSNYLNYLFNLNAVVEFPYKVDTTNTYCNIENYFDVLLDVTDHKLKFYVESYRSNEILDILKRDLDTDNKLRVCSKCHKNINIIKNILNTIKSKKLFYRPKIHNNYIGNVYVDFTLFANAENKSLYCEFNDNKIGHLGLIDNYLAIFFENNIYFLNKSEISIKRVFVAPAINDCTHFKFLNEKFIENKNKSFFFGYTTKKTFNLPEDFKKIDEEIKKTFDTNIFIVKYRKKLFFREKYLIYDKNLNFLNFEYEIKKLLLKKHNKNEYLKQIIFLTVLSVFYFIIIKNAYINYKNQEY